MTRPERQTSGNDPLTELAAALLLCDEEELPALLGTLPPEVIRTLLETPGALDGPAALGLSFAELGPQPPTTPLEQAQELDAGFRDRPHLSYLSHRLSAAVRDVEGGTSRQLLVAMPPRAGKSTLSSMYLPAWLLRRHPEWSIGLVSHDGDFATSWGRKVRSVIESHQTTLGIKLAPGVGAASEWETTAGGGVLARGIGGSITGRGFKVLVCDDVVKGIVDAHSPRVREMVWDRWRSDIYTRLEPPYLLVVIGTRWHEDDFIGRLLSTDYEGDPRDWEVISFPAIAEADDVLGRSPGSPLYSPLLDETEAQALQRWATAKETVGTYTWAALYQQRPSPPTGAIFDTGWLRFWTTDPAKVQRSAEITGDPTRLVLLPSLRGGRWLDSWDMAFKATTTSDWVVGQRWCKVGPYRYLIDQQRDRLSFTETVAAMRAWVSPTLDLRNQLVHERLVEEKANGSAVIDTLRAEVSGIVAINPQVGKEGRARAITPEFESGHVYFPHPSEPGYDWVDDLLSELRAFPNDQHDDQVDALTQALLRLRDIQGGQITVPGGNATALSATLGAAQANPWQRVPTAAAGGLIRAAKTDLRRPGRIGVVGNGGGR